MQVMCTVIEALVRSHDDMITCEFCGAEEIEADQRTFHAFCQIELARCYERRELWCSHAVEVGVTLKRLEQAIKE